jgi:hypothetical protein
MKEKFHEDEEVNIFLTQRTDYLTDLLSLCGLEAKYNQMKIQWIIIAIVGGLAGAVLAYTQMAELTIIGFIVGVALGAGGFVAYLGQLAKHRH